MVRIRPFGGHGGSWAKAHFDCTKELRRARPFTIAPEKVGGIHSNHARWSVEPGFAAQQKAAARPRKSADSPPVKITFTLLG
jgi:hypothetical protein